MAAEAGAVACGVAAAGDVESGVATDLQRWVAEGNHADMRWLERHVELRRNTSSVLPGCRSVVVCAFSYKPPVERDSSLPRFALYAYGEDYHDVVRRRLKSIADRLTQLYGGTHRVCVDTAPLAERYWATKAGIGFQGRNCLLSIPDYGSYVVLGEILTTLDITPSSPCTKSCPADCRRCIEACPGHALSGDGHLDSRRCLSYLTIEHRGQIPPEIQLHGQVFGCDICQRTCPMNKNTLISPLPEFAASPQMLTLSRDQILALDETGFRQLFGHSAVRRTGLEGLKRNAIANINKF